jgi:hypothetical protein
VDPSVAGPVADLSVADPVAAASNSKQARFKFPQQLHQYNFI